MRQVLRRRIGLNFALNGFFELQPGHRKIVLLLKVHPELRAVSKKTGQAKRRIS